MRVENPIAETPPSPMLEMKTQQQRRRKAALMHRLVERLGRAVKGVLTGFDRIVFKGSILPLAYEKGAMSFLRWRGVLNKDYKGWMLRQSEQLIEAIDRHSREQCGIGITHLSSWREDKEQLAQRRQKARGIESGLLGAWSCLESGRSYRAPYCAQSGYPQLRRHTPTCKHVYLYVDHADYGWMNLRIQTWFPYPIQICLNGLEWLRRRMEQRCPFGNRACPLKAHPRRLVAKKGEGDR